MTGSCEWHAARMLLGTVPDSKVIQKQACKSGRRRKRRRSSSQRSSLGHRLKRGFKQNQYLHLSQDHFGCACALAFVGGKRKQPSFENLVAEAFLSFPARFQLEGYPDWPNAHVIGKAWVRLEAVKKWLTGSASEGCIDAAW